jgi:NAD(P)-dependent dehydrogenase (short-subunit alcohol dehydrogenase family)
VINDVETPQLRGQTVVVTGSSSGIGAAAARRFRQLGATVAVVGRSPERTAAVAAEIGAESHLVDFSCLDDVRRLAVELLARYPRIDVLANNAGGLFFSRQTTADGHEMTFQVNYLAPFLLTNLLLDRLAEAPHGARVINTVSMFYRWGRLNLDDVDDTRRRYSNQKAYYAAKLATVMFTLELSRRMAGTTVAASAFHPGIVATDVYRDNSFVGCSRHQSWARPCSPAPSKVPNHCCTLPQHPIRSRSMARTSTACADQNSRTRRLLTPTWQRACGNARRN